MRSTFGSISEQDEDKPDRPAPEKACDECRLDHEVDIGPGAIDAAIELCDALGSFLPVLCPEDIIFNGSSDDPAKKLKDRIRLEATLSASMEQLREHGIAVFVGSYVDFIQRPRYDIDEGCWSTRVNQKHEDVKFGIVRLDRRVACS